MATGTKNPPKAPAAPPAPPVAETPASVETETTDTNTEATETEAERAQRRPSAVIEEFNFDEEMVVPPRAPGAPRESKWTKVLDKLYTATEEGLVKTNEDGTFKFTKIGHYLNTNGARSQIQIFNKDADIKAAYEFKTLPAKQQEGEPHPGSDLWARVRVTNEAPADQAPAA